MLTLIGSVLAFVEIILSHLGVPTAPTGLWGVAASSTAPQHFCAWWITLWLAAAVSAYLAIKRHEPNKGLLLVIVLLHSYPFCYGVLAFMTGRF